MYAYRWINHDRKTNNTNALIELKKIPDRKVIFQRKSYPFNIDSLYSRFNQFYKLVESKNVPIIYYDMCIIHDYGKNVNIDNLDYELCRTVEKSVDDKLPYIRTIPKNTYASIIHEGSLVNALESYYKLRNWIKNNGYKITGPLYYVYIIGRGIVKSDDQLVTEILRPVKKA